MLCGCHRNVGRMLLLVSLLVVPLLLTTSAVYAQPHTVHDQPAAPLNATIYLGKSVLLPMFQSRLDQQIPDSFNNVINTMLDRLPPANRDWASRMASTLLQPSATLTQLTPQQDGLLTTVRVKLYADDPKPIDSSMLVKFSTLDTSTIEVTTEPLKGSPSLMNGKLTTFHIPVGQLTSVKTTPACGDAILALGMQVAVSLNQQSQALPARNSNAENLTTYVEIPSSSLEQLGNSIGSMQISQNMSASNIHVAIEGSDLVVNADIMYASLKLGSARTVMQPQAVNGNLAVHVLKTDVTVFRFFKFPDNSYNQRVEQSLNARLSKAFAGKLYITDAALGSNNHVTCAADDSLLLTGTAKID